MIVTHKIRVDLARKGLMPCIEAVQGDRYSRNLEAELYAHGKPVTLPAGGAVLIRYRKPDGTGGSYDTLPDGTKAWHMAENVLTVALAPQVCTAPGQVELVLTLLAGQAELSSFRILLEVQPLPGGVGESREYINTTCFIPQPEGAVAGQYLAVSSLSKDGRIATVESVDPPKSAYELAREGGYTGTEAEFRQQLAKNIDATLTASGVAADAAAVGQALQREANRRESQIATERSRIDQLTRLENGSTSGDAELADIRIGHDGTVHGSAGTAVRAQIGAVTREVEALKRPTAVEYTPQNLTGLQKSQARKNIGADHVKTAEGTAIDLTDSMDGCLTALSLWGMSTQAGTPSGLESIPVIGLGTGGSMTVTVTCGGESRTLALSIPGGLHGIPVAAGGNYTDGAGQQWISDEIDLGRGVYVQRVNRIELNGSEGWLTANTIKGINILYLQPTFPLAAEEAGLCTHFPYDRAKAYGGQDGYIGAEASNVTGLSRLWVSTTMTVVDLKGWLQRKYDEDDAIVVYYPLKEAVETPLPAETMEAFAQLQTGSGGTQLRNDEDAFMKAVYPVQTGLERWVFELADGSTVVKEVMVK